LDKPFEVHDPLKNQNYSGDRLEFTARLQADSKHQPRTAAFSYSLHKGNDVILDVALSERDGKSARKKPEFELSSQRYSLTRHTGRAWGLPQPLRFYGFPDEVAAYYQNAAFASDFVLELERMLKSVFYVGPLREYPK